MTIYKSAADEIAEAMNEALEKDAGVPIFWEKFKKVIDSAEKCADLQVPWRWLQSGKCALFQDKAFGHFLAKERALKKKVKEEGNECSSR